MDIESQKVRLARSQEHELHCLRVEFTDDSVIFTIDGLTDVYTVEINQNAQFWDVGVSPSCNCEDHLWRSCICKHIAFALKLMGCTDEFLLSERCWEGPTQADLYELLGNVPACVGYRNYPQAINTSKTDGGLLHVA